MSTKPEQSTPPGGSDRVTSVRAAAAQQRAARDRAAKRQRVLLISLLGTALLGLATVIGIVVHTSSTGHSAAAPASPGSVRTPTVVTAHGGILLGADGVITPTPQQAKDPFTAFPGKVVVTVYADFLCPWCNRFEQQNRGLLQQLRADGTVIVDFHPVAILDRSSQGTAYSTRTAAAAFALAQSAPKAFDGFVNGLYDAQPAENTTGLDDSKIAAVAKKAGAGSDVAAHLADGTYSAYAAEATTLAQTDLGKLSTPTILINGSPLTIDWTVDGALKAAITNAAAGH